MKKILLSLLLTLEIFSVCAQSLEEHKKMYLNKTFVVDTLEAGRRKSGYEHFLKNINQSYINPLNKPFYDSLSHNSKYETLVGKSFICEEVGELSEDPDYFYLKLRSKELGVIYSYYLKKYDPFNMYSLEVMAQEKAKSDSIDMAKQRIKDNPCLLITEEYDEIDKEKVIGTPFSIDDKTIVKYHFVKYIHKGIATYYLYLESTGGEADIDQKGVIILLKNGKRLNKPNALVETDIINRYNTSLFRRSSQIILTPADIAILKTSPINKYRLYTDTETADQSEALYKMFLCLLTRK